MTKHHFTWLALGDSYTIGEGVPLHESFPYQTVQLLRQSGWHMQAPEIVAKTGWTSFELAEHLLHTKLNEQYDFVTLLIGVNNQYRGLPLKDFENDLEFLLKKAIHFSGDKPQHVIVISIPDWGVTPFAADRDSNAIALAIDKFNNICASKAAAHQIHFITITAETRLAKDDVSLLATDQLHYSGKAMHHWANAIANMMKDIVADK
jgi:lysophospholipase L1-like esterase